MSKFFPIRRQFRINCRRPRRKSNQWEHHFNNTTSSDTGELHHLAELNVASIDLEYKLSKRTDQFGNQFRYRAKITDAKGAQIGRWAWDVFLVNASASRLPKN